MKFSTIDGNVNEILKKKDVNKIFDN